MKKLLIATLLIPVLVLADSEKIGGFEWSYRIVVSDGENVGRGRRLRRSDQAITSIINGHRDKNGIAIIEKTRFSGDVTIPAKLGGCAVLAIDEYAFRGCKDLKSIVIPANVKMIGEVAFGGCENLSSVTMSEGVIEIGGYAFSGCKSLKSIKIPSSVRSIGKGAFCDCEALTSVSLPSSVKTIEKYMFSNCKALGSVSIPQSVDRISDHAFSGCESLTTVLIPLGVKAIGEHAFFRCKSLKSVTMPSSVITIGDSAFANCEVLDSVTVPSGVTQIGSSAFANCRIVKIPSSVKKIGYGAFRDCTAICIDEVDGERSAIIDMIKKSGCNEKYIKTGDYVLTPVVECDVERSHGVSRADACYSYSKRFHIQALKDGGYNYIISDGFSDVRMIVFNNGDIFDACAALKSAIDKARKWIEVGLQNNKMLSVPKDMSIDIPCGCAAEIPRASDTWVVFDLIAQIPSHKSMKTGLKFGFTEKERWLLINCGEVTIEFNWQAKNDAREFAKLESACDVHRLLEFYSGRADDTALFKLSNTYKDIPKGRKSNDAPKWEACNVIDALLTDFPGNKSVALSRCANGSINYSFSPYQFSRAQNNVIIFPNDSYEAAFSAIEEAFKVALTWRDIARKKGVVSIVKEIDIKAPVSVGVKIMGGNKSSIEKWQTTICDEKALSDVKPTKFWFSVETEAEKKGEKYVLDAEKSVYGLYLGNENATLAFEIEDKTVNALHLINPAFGLEAKRTDLQSKKRTKAIEDSLFK